MRFDQSAARRWTFLLLCLLPCIAALPGCGNKATYHVRGKVNYKDGSVPKGSPAVVLFAPAEDTTAEVRKGASGSIESDGSFDMVTRMPGDGVYRGSYVVSFRVLRESANGSINLVAPKFATATTSPFKVNVDRDISDLSYEIEKAEGVAPAGPAPAEGPGSGPGT